MLGKDGRRREDEPRGNTKKYTAYCKSVSNDRSVVIEAGGRLTATGLRQILLDFDE